MIKVQSITKSYFRRDLKFDAVSNVSFEQSSGDFTGIIGRSGSGKSTLINMIAGLLTPSSGNILYNNKAIYINQNDEERSLYRNTEIGFVPQQNTLISSLNVLENVCMPHFLYRKDVETVDIAKQLLSDLDIFGISTSYPRELSGGERKRVIIARALINQPKLLIADEPTSDLDINSTKLVMKFLERQHKQGLSILFLTHELDTLSYSNKVYTMCEGQLQLGNHMII